MSSILTPTAIETISGVFDVANPKAEDVKIFDIAWALSRESRFTGHTLHATPYSVGQHSLAVLGYVEEMFLETPIRKLVLEIGSPAAIELLRAGEAPTWLRLLTVLHDASEAYLRDLPSPVKKVAGLGEAYKRIETSVMHAIHECFGLTLNQTDGYNLSQEQLDVGNELVHLADLYALTVEAYNLLPTKGAAWAPFNLEQEELERFIHAKAPTTVALELESTIVDLLA